ncbi:calpain-7-like isoform X2 [Daphnia pulex]|uniref:calpain-7-like isoform X2 n=1 Tax=Daphnia pulex TaxID=6669 RepID=UPI001EDF9D10|nr:calpain-7-like isoform X2 [Daphnia pulex]XP_046445650.1 calpain-7-like isoform X2 [Daphnia pulex]
MTSSGTTLQQAIELGKRAVLLDQEGKHEGAAYFYEQAAVALEEIVATNSIVQSATLAVKANEYKQRATSLRNLYLSSNDMPSLTEEQQSILNNARNSVNKALEVDEMGEHKKALPLYIDAVEVCSSAAKATSDKNLQLKLTKLAMQALNRAEELKMKPQTNKKTASASPAASESAPVEHLSVSNLKVSGAQTYSSEEKKVLEITSMINGREYVPFMAGDLQERFILLSTFSDRHGKLSLSPKQKKSFSRWARAEEISADPKVIENIDCFSIKQTVVSDCSFVASLAVSAQYEKRFNKKLITNIIYPQNKSGMPLYNSCGKYMIRLRINGVSRKVVIDDYLPMGRHGELLCSYSVNRNELWVSLLEKAYMKVMGGYDFPGSNSNIDLHALTGWIPERVALKSSGGEEFKKEELFKKLYDRFHKGDVLVTVATGEMSEAAEVRTGLVSAHAYALLNIQEVKGIRLIMLKNPWSHVRWKGNYSELDANHWTEDLKKQLNYNPESAANFDNGVFWIDYDSLCTFFDVVYLSWNPSLFTHTFSIIGCWNAGSGPVKDLYNIGENPQFSLTVRSPGSAAVWILLSRHITDIDDFRENKEYITVLVYKNKGKRVYYPADPPPYIDGIRINSPHYLCKLLHTQAGVERYTLVISQYEKSNTINYSLRVYSSCPIELKKITNPYRFKDEIRKDGWKGVSAGGCGNNPRTYPNNPKYQFTLEKTSDLLIDLKGPKEFLIGFDVTCISLCDNDSSSGTFTKKSSGAFRSGFVILELENVPAGTYQIVPSTFHPGQEGSFFLTIQSPNQIKLKKIHY